jgi:hypothetical protein
VEDISFVKGLGVEYPRLTEINGIELQIS